MLLAVMRDLFAASLPLTLLCGKGWVLNEAAEPSTPEQDEFDQFYEDAVAKGFLLNTPKNHLSVQGGEIVVKVNRPSAFAPWTPVPWHQARAEYDNSFEY